MAATEAEHLREERERREVRMVAEDEMRLRNRNAQAIDALEEALGAVRAGHQQEALDAASLAAGYLARARSAQRRLHSRGHDSG